MRRLRGWPQASANSVRVDPVKKLQARQSHGFVEEGVKGIEIRMAERWQLVDKDKQPDMATGLPILILRLHRRSKKANVEKYPLSRYR